MDKAGLRLLKLGFYSLIPMMALSFVLLPVFGGWGVMILLPSIMAMGIPLYREVKGVLYSANGGVSPWQSWSKRKFVIEVLKCYTKWNVIIYMIPVVPAIVGSIRNYRIWKLNRKPISRRTLLNFKAWKPEVRDMEGNDITLTSRGVIAFLTVVSWFLFYFIGDWIKLDAVSDFILAGVGGTIVLGALVGLYFSRRKRKMIIKKIQRRWGKGAFAIYSIASALGTATVFGVFGWVLGGWWWLGALPAGALVLVVYLNGVRRVGGFHYYKWARPGQG